MIASAQKAGPYFEHALVANGETCNQLRDDGGGNIDDMSVVRSFEGNDNSGNDASSTCSSPGNRTAGYQKTSLIALPCPYPDVGGGGGVWCSVTGTKAFNMYGSVELMRIAEPPLAGETFRGAPTTTSVYSSTKTFLGSSSNANNADDSRADAYDGACCFDDDSSCLVRVAQRKVTRDGDNAGFVIEDEETKTSRGAIA